MADRDPTNLSRRSFLSGIGASAIGTGTSSVNNSSQDSEANRYKIGLPLAKEWETGLSGENGYSGGEINMGSTTDDTIYLSVDETEYESARLVALDRSTGNRRWESTFDQDISAPSVDEENLFITRGSELLAFHSDEQPEYPIWRERVDFDLTDPQMTFEDQVCLTANNYETVEKEGTTRHYLREGGIFAFSQEGNLSWKDRGPAMDTPYYRKNTLYHWAGEMYFENDQFYTTSGRIFARDSITGELKWKTSDLEIEYVQPAEDLGLLLGAQSGNTLTGIELDSGSKRWEVDLERSIQDFTNNADSFFVSGNGLIEARDAETKNRIWSRSDIGPTFDLTYSGGLLFVGTANSKCFALDANTGNRVWKNSMPEGTVYERTHDGNLYTIASDWIYSYSGKRKQALQALSSTRSRNSLNEVFSPFANLLGRERKLARADQAFEERRYQKVQTAVEAANLRQDIAGVGIAALGGGSIYTGSRYVAQKRRVDQFKSQLDDLRTAYPIESGILRGKEPTNLIQQGEVAIASLKRSRFGIAPIKNSSNGEYANLESRIASTVKIAPDLKNISNQLSDQNHLKTAGKWRDEFGDSLEAGDVQNIGTLIERCDNILSLTERYDDLSNNLSKSRFNLSDLETVLQKVQNPNSNINDKSINYCQAAITTLETYSKNQNLLQQYNLQPIERSIQRGLGASPAKRSQACSNLLETSELVKTAAVAEVNRTDLNLEHSDLHTQDLIHRLQDALNKQSLSEANQIQQLIENLASGIWEPGDLFRYSPTEFEHLIADLYSSKGYHAEVSQQSNDQGIDVRVYGSCKELIVQVKQYSEGNNVGRPTIQQTAGVRELFGADIAVVITSSKFTKTAREAADEYGPSMKIINGADLLQQLSRSEVVPPTGQSSNSREKRERRQYKQSKRSGNGDHYSATKSPAEGKAYKKLGLKTGANQQDIQEAYRERVKEVHPDRGGSRDEFLEVKAAYDLLSE